MKSKIILPFLFLLTVLISPSLMAQDDYYRPDSLRKDQPERKEIPPVERKPQDQKPVLAEKKKLEDFKDKKFIERLRLGGSFGLSVGSVTNINVSPMAGYELTEKLVGGVGATIMYYRYKYYEISTMNYGGRGFLMYSIIPEVNIIGEFEALNVEASYQKRKWLGSPMAGASYSQPLGGKFIKAVHLTALYNFSYDSQIDQYTRQNLSPYGSPFVFRVTFL